MHLLGLIDEFEALATRRPDSCFATDIEASQSLINTHYANSRVLIIGGAGSIGAAVVEALSTLPLACLHIIDQNENNLAELVRRLRSRRGGLRIEDFRTLPLDYGAEITHHFINSEKPYNHVYNFAALKHVRSEKDVFSLVQMLDTNVVKQARLMTWLKQAQFTGTYYSVSTDKAANPVSLMGASKRLMEHVIFHEAYDGKIKRTSARFANVAFSEGSILQAFLKRRALNQPISVPQEVRRYFISHLEAAQISILACLHCSDRQIAIPRFDPASELIDLSEIAVQVIEALGFSPKIYYDEESARDNAETDIGTGRYPLLLTPLDTSGEKPYEEFLGAGESAVELGLHNVLAVNYLPSSDHTTQDAINLCRSIVQGQAAPDRSELVAAIERCIPQFVHKDTGRNLDGRM